MQAPQREENHHGKRTTAQEQRSEETQKETDAGHLSHSRFRVLPLIAATLHQMII